MNYKMLRNVLEVVVLIMVIVGVVSAAINATFGGFTPIAWFAIAILAVLIIICSEVTQLRAFIENRK